MVLNIVFDDMADVWCIKITTFGVFIYIYICKLILGTNGRLSTHEWVHIWYLFGILCT